MTFRHRLKMLYADALSALAYALNGLVIRNHHPVDIGTPESPVPWCANCETKWPCRSMRDAVDRRDRIGQ